MPNCCWLSFNTNNSTFDNSRFKYTVKPITVEKYKEKKNGYCIYVGIYFFVKEEKRDGFEDIFQKLKKLKQDQKKFPNS